VGVPVVSIFVQVYNTAPYLRRCLESVLALRGPWEREILVIDDASSDGSDRILAEYREKMRVVRHPTNTGANATANEGYSACRGKYLIRLDSDDSFRPNLLEELVPLLEQNPEAGLAYGDVALMDEKDRITSSSGNVKRGGRPAVGDEFFELCTENFICAPATLVRRKALEPLLPIPSQYSFLDWYVTTGIAHEWKTACSNSVLADYRVHLNNQHAKMIIDGSGEAISYSVLKRLWEDPYRAEEKKKMKNTVFGRHYYSYGDKYFGFGLLKKARFCYIQGFINLPKDLWEKKYFHRVVGCYLPKFFYKEIKKQIKLLFN
jgi:glycosyltransferase involved in cell wall biosynthesis